MKKNANAKEKPKSSFKRKEIKKEARKNLKRHYFRNILIVFLTAFIINGGYLLNTNEAQEFHIQDNTYEISGKKSNAEIILDFLSKQQPNFRLLSELFRTLLAKSFPCRS